MDCIVHHVIDIPPMMEVTEEFPLKKKNMNKMVLMVLILLSVAMGDGKYWSLLTCCLYCLAEIQVAAI